MVRCASTASIKTEIKRKRNTYIANSIRNECHRFKIYRSNYKSIIYTEGKYTLRVAVVHGIALARGASHLKNLNNDCDRNREQKQKEKEMNGREGKSKRD